MTPGSDPETSAPSLTRLVQSRAVLVRRGEFGIALLRADAASPRVLTGSGASVWDEFVEPSTVAAASERLAKRFGVGSGDVTRDVEPVVAALREFGLLEKS